VSSRLRLAPLAVVAVLALPVLSACDSTPGAAAVIGRYNISTSSLQTQVNLALADGRAAQQASFNRAGFTRDLLTHMINVHLVHTAAIQHHVTVTQQQIAAEENAFETQAGGRIQLLNQAAQGGISAEQLPAFIRYAAIEQALSTSLTEQLPATQAQLEAQYQKDIDNYDKIQIAQIPVKSLAQANLVLAKAKADPSSFGALAMQYSTDAATAANGGLVGYVGRTQVQKLVGAADQDLTPGTFVVAHSSSGYSVVHIISRQTQPISAVTNELKAALFASVGSSLVQTTLTKQAAQLGVHVSPRYGQWDSKTNAVVALPNPVSSAG
jgi:parvulin-like peptidyl-prolyl isomerase